jgi:hypothetical protein
MTKLPVIVLALVGALIAMIPRLSEAGHNLNHSQTMMRG